MFSCWYLSLTGMTTFLLHSFIALMASLPEAETNAVILVGSLRSLLISTEMLVAIDGFSHASHICFNSSIKASLSASDVNLLMFSRFNTAFWFLQYYNHQTATKQIHPQIKSLSWSTTCKTGQTKSFQHESKGTLKAHTEDHTRMVLQVVNSYGLRGVTRCMRL
mgnify:CR=1 FL=1